MFLGFVCVRSFFRIEYLIWNESFCIFFFVFWKYFPTYNVVPKRFFQPLMNCAFKSVSLFSSSLRDYKLICTLCTKCIWKKKYFVTFSLDKWICTWFGRSAAHLSVGTLKNNVNRNTWKISKTWYLSMSSMCNRKMIFWCCFFLYFLNQMFLSSLLHNARIYFKQNNSIKM